MNINYIIRYIALVMAFAVGSCIVLKADNDVEVEGTYTYFGNGDQSRNECKRIALESARNDALAKAFGTNVSTNIFNRVTKNNELESSYWDFLSQTEVGGVWIADIGEPTYKISTDDEGNFIVECNVKGKAKKRDNQSVEFDANVLKNTTKGNESETKFKVNDRVFISFQAPMDGYVAIYLVDDQQNVYTLFPYMGENSTSVQVKKDKKYMFFDTSSEQPTDTDVDEIFMLTDRQVERNDLYVIYSPNPFNKAKDEYFGDLVPRQLKLKDFNKWLINIRKNDSKMNVKLFPIEIIGEETY